MQKKINFTSIARLTSILVTSVLAACASVKTQETNYIEHPTTEWPLLTAQRAAVRQAARISGWAQEAERLHVWEHSDMLPVPHVPEFGFSANDQPAKFTAGNRIPPPPVVADSKIATSSVRQARLEALHDCALTFGVRQGMREQMARIQQVLGREDVGQMMDDAFDFAPVMLTRYLVPPSVTESRDEFEQQNAGTLRLREARYHVVTQSRFTSVRPNWRGFMHQIFVSNDERSPCSAQAFGLTSEETAWWQKAESLSRLQGIEAANLVFSNALERLASTHTGMLKYHEWVWRGLIDIPQIAQSSNILTLDQKSQDARLHERLLRVTHLPRFDSRRSQWEAAAPHMEESKAAAIDLSLPVCSGAGCSNDRFAFQGLRHAASEEYFIHPTLMLRGGGGHRAQEPVSSSAAPGVQTFPIKEPRSNQRTATQRRRARSQMLYERTPPDPVILPPHVRNESNQLHPTEPHAPTPVVGEQVIRDTTGKIISEHKAPESESVKALPSVNDETESPKSASTKKTEQLLSKTDIEVPNPANASGVTPSQSDTSATAEITQVKTAARAPTGSLDNLAIPKTAPNTQPTEATEISKKPTAAKTEPSISNYQTRRQTAKEMIAKMDERNQSKAKALRTNKVKASGWKTQSTSSKRKAKKTYVKPMTNNKSNENN